MGLPEPTGELWQAVKALSNPWPADDEDHATALGQAWQRSAAAIAGAAGQVHAAGTAAGAAWPDSAGTTMTDGVNQHLGQLDQAAGQARQQASSAHGYADALRGAKTQITNTVADYDPIYGDIPSGGIFTQARIWVALWVNQLVNEIITNTEQALHVQNLPAGPVHEGQLKDGKLSGKAGYQGPGISFQSPDKAVNGEIRDWNTAVSSASVSKDGVKFGLGVGPSVDFKAAQPIKLGPLSVQPEFGLQPNVHAGISASVGDDGKPHLELGGGFGVVDTSWNISLDTEELSREFGNW